MSAEWVVDEALVVPSAVISNKPIVSISTSNSDSSSANSNSNIDNTNNNIDNTNNNSDSNSIEFDVDGPQPSDLWPSDHFMLVVKASF